MDDNARLHLQNMIKANQVEDQTGLIRDLKHSVLLRKDIDALVALREKYKDDPDTLHMEAMMVCSFLFTYYTDIYNKIRKDEIDLAILGRFLVVLARIEDGEIDQHEGSFLVGTLLKELYVDSALKKADKLNQEHGEAAVEEKVEPLPISWRKYKQGYR
jgi:hypothetical protein